jgi:uncharacterized membrane protein
MVENAREQLALDLLEKPYGDLTPIQKSVIDLMASETPTAGQAGLAIDDRTPAEKLADQVAAIGGSWGFIIGFGVVLASWIGWNVLTVSLHWAFDIYPFIFLNLILSMLAAVQAPVIMMSQNRAALKDREAAEHDATVNLRAELEIMLLHDKLDAVRDQQLVELIKCQNETLELLRTQMAALTARVAG